MVESLSNNADKSDVDAEVETHRATEVHDQPQPPDGKGEAGGVAELDDNGTVRSGQVPSLALTDTFTVTNESDLTTLNSAELGDVGIVTSQSRSYILTGDYSVQGNWVEFESPPAPVDDVNGQTGSVSLGAGDVDAEPSGAVENHRTGETHATAQPPESHGNQAHLTDYLPSSDYDPEADTHSRYTDSEAANAAPVQSVNGQTGSVTVESGASVFRDERARQPADGESGTFTTYSVDSAAIVEYSIYLIATDGGDPAESTVEVTFVFEDGDTQTKTASAAHDPAFGSNSAAQSGTNPQTPFQVSRITEIQFGFSEASLGSTSAEVDFAWRVTTA